MFFPERFLRPLGIAFAFVATHNHFVLDRGGKVFKQSAPIIKLPDTATEEDHLALLAYLNSSTACFWMKQVFYPKGGSGIGRGIQDEGWESRFEYDGTKLASLPLSEHLSDIRPLGAKLDSLAKTRQQTSVAARLERWLEEDGGDAPDTDVWTQDDRTTFHQMVALQEELDWLVYRFAGLLSEEELLSARGVSPAHLPANGLAPGHRPFEIVLASDKSRKTTWFTRNRYADPQSLPSYPADYAKTLRGRAWVIENNKLIRLLEQPEHKRRWTVPDYDADIASAMESAILDRAEHALSGSSLVINRPELLRRVADGLSSKLEFMAPAWAKAPRLIEDQSIPYLARLRFVATGFQKHLEWQRTWDLQRAEDAGKKTGPIPVPPKYASKDYRSTSYWQLRGKLDVPKERFISYPGCESDEDGEPVFGWAGWDHAQRAQALVALYQDRKTREGWGVQKLTPMLAGVLELLPWLEQWHNEPSPEFDTTVFEAYHAFLDAELRDLGLTRDDLRNWRPEEKKKGRAKKQAQATT